MEKATFKVPLRARGNLTCTFHSHFFMVLGNGTQGLMQAKQMLYHQATSPDLPTLLLLLGFCAENLVYPIRGCGLFLIRNSYKVLNLDNWYLSKGFHRMLVLPPRDGFWIFMMWWRGRTGIVGRGQGCYMSKKSRYKRIVDLRSYVALE